MRLFRIASFEFRYMFLSVQTLVIAVICFGAAALFTAQPDEFQATIRGGNVFINSPTMLTFMLLLSCIPVIFIMPSYIANAVLKDVDNKFDAIIFATPISKNDYLFGRFLGAFFAMVAALAFLPLGAYVGTYWPWAPSEMLAPTALWQYAVVFFGFMVPTLSVLAATMFAVAILSRSMLYCYITALGLLVLYTTGLATETIAQLWDPFMLSTFEDQTRYWTASELNTKLVSYSGVILTNRILWSTFAVAMFTLGYLRFSFSRAAKPAKQDKKVIGIDKAKINAATFVGQRGTPTWDGSTPFKQFLARTSYEMSMVLKSMPFLILMGFSIFMTVVSLADREVLYDVNAYPVTRIMLGQLTEGLLWALMGVAMFYGADIVWRDRVSKFSEILDALPAPNWVFVASKLVALVTVMISIQLLGIMIAVSTQILNGYYTFEVGHYLERGFLFLSIPVYLAVLSVFFQVLVKNRFLGLMLMGAFWLFTLGSAVILGVEHPLLRYALGGIAAPLTDMNGSGRFLEGTYALRLYWTAIAGILLLLTVVLWNRGILQPVRYRMRRLIMFKSPRYAVPFAASVTLLLGAGSFIYYNTNVLNQYRTSSEIQDMQVAYEQQYRQYEKLPMPLITDVKLDVDIYPALSRVETRGTEILQNKTDADISTIHLVFPPRLADVPFVAIEGATQTFVDDVYRYYIFDLEKPMVPGETRVLSFETIIQNNGFRHRAADIEIVANGTAFDSSRITPHIGFDFDPLLSSKNERKKRGLPPLPRRAKLEDASAYHRPAMASDGGFVHYETTISTAIDQTALSPGYLEREWTVGDRRYFSYKMDLPIVNYFNFLSARYEVKRDKWNGVDIEIFHHQPHDYNVDRMMDSVRDSLDYFGEAFGPYQFRQMRVVEFPAFRKRASSFPNTISYSEEIGFLADIRDAGTIDVPYYVTAHEMAHQWWPYQAMPADVQGAGFLSETLSQYSAMLLMEQKYGKHQLRKYLKFELDKYLNGRGEDAEGELPLYRVEGQQYVFYRKGSLIMYALKDYVGEEAVNRALRRLIANFGSNPERYALSTDLLGYFKEESGPEWRSMIEDFFEKITLYDLQMENSRVEEMADGRFKVFLDVKVAKYYADENGVETQAVFDLPVDIGIFLKDPDAKDFGADDVLLLEKRQVKDGSSTIEIILDRKPTFVGIDPYSKLIDRDSDDNVRAVDETE